MTLVRGYTTNFSFGLVEFNSPNWHDVEHRNWKLVDSLIASTYDAAPFATAVGTNTITADYTPNITAYTNGLTLLVELVNAPTGPMTINVDGLGAKAIKVFGNDVASGDLRTGDIVRLLYDGTDFNVLAPLRDTNKILVRGAPTGFSQSDPDLDHLVLDDTNTGITFLASETGTSEIVFKAASRRGGIVYNYTTNGLTIETPNSSIEMTDKLLFSSADYEYLFQVDGAQMLLSQVSPGVFRLGNSSGLGNGLFINVSTNRIGVNTASPTVALEVAGTVKATAFQGPLSVSELTGILPITAGGTGAANQIDAIDNLGLGDLAVKDTVNNGDWSGTQLSVPNGGTGATTLTGYVKGNGTGAFTAAAQIPISDIDGFGAAVGNADNLVTGLVALERLGMTVEDSSDGYVILPGGIIIQWGSAAAAPPNSITFPIPFPTAVFQVVACPIATNQSNANEANFAIISQSTTGASFGGDSSNNSGVRWIAIGN